MKVQTIRQWCEANNKHGKFMYKGFSITFWKFRIDVRLKCKYILPKD